MEFRQLELTIVSAKGLKKAKDVPTMNVYVEAAFSNTTAYVLPPRRTPAARDCGSNLSWNFQLQFPVDETAARLHGLALVLKVKCELPTGTGPGGDKELGEARVALKDLLDKFGKEKGELKLEYKFNDKYVGGGAGYMLTPVPVPQASNFMPQVAYPTSAPTPSMPSYGIGMLPQPMAPPSPYQQATRDVVYATPPPPSSQPMGIGMAPPPPYQQQTTMRDISYATPPPPSSQSMGMGVAPTPLYQQPTPRDVSRAAPPPSQAMSMGMAPLPLYHQPTPRDGYYAALLPSQPMAPPPHYQPATRDIVHAAPQPPQPAAPAPTPDGYPPVGYPQQSYGLAAPAPQEGYGYNGYGDQPPQQDQGGFDCIGVGVAFDGGMTGGMAANDIASNGNDGSGYDAGYAYISGF